MTFFAKLLLFGEYTVVRGGEALAIPYRRYGGKWAYAPGQPALQHRLGQFLQYLEALEEKGELLAPLDLAAFAEALVGGLYFDSNIPMGYGLGSSGTLCAAVLHDFKTREPAKAELRPIFAQLESFFHGASSGTDPLISYLDQAVIFRSRMEISTVALPESWGENSHLFLLDSGQARTTGPLVTLFLEKCVEPSYQSLIDQQLLPASNRAIQAFLAGNGATLFQETDIISRFQQQYFPEMIPASVRPAWELGLAGEQFRLKLCGAGGGGFFLGVCRDFQVAAELLAGYRILQVFP